MDRNETTDLSNLPQGKHEEPENSRQAIANAPAGGCQSKAQQGRDISIEVTEEIPKRRA